MTTKETTRVMRFTPEMYMDYHVRRMGIQIEDIGVAPTVIMTWFTRIRESLTSAVNGRVLSNAPFRHAISGEINSTPVTIVQCPIGAPGTISHMEELIVCGARRFIGIGAAGSLQPDNPIGSLLIPDECVRDEGTSRHYLPEDAVVCATPTLQSRLVLCAQSLGYPVSVGSHWTTDAIYREPVSDIDRHRESGVLGVDMETSAMYALGQVRGVEVANVLAVSDELWHAWNPAFGSDALDAGLERACEIALAATV
ncbi:MAG: nucleoside phosphorylase [Alicyclobacillaceae bacterium]|nr:nucleoside phosphorylase [Alicyclobacillaceae bacterium]